MYDSLLFGNGLSLALQYLLHYSLSDNEFIEYVFPDRFFSDFFNMPNHKRIKRDFIKTFNKDTKSYESIHTHVNDILSTHIEEINGIGFERWVSKQLFSNKFSEDDFSLIKPYLYSLYNYWFYFLNQHILNDCRALKILKEASNRIHSQISGEKYTTNFDSLLDPWLSPRHIHGRFAIPYTSFGDLISFRFNKDEYFEYSFLFGGNGLEKMSRLDRIRKEHTLDYDLDFLYRDIDSFTLGHLLIFGVSFGKSYILSDEFLEAYPEHKAAFINRSVDGHLILRLGLLIERKCIEKLTIAYYSDADLDYYKWLFKMTEFSDFIEYKKSSDIFSFT